MNERTEKLKAELRAIYVEEAERVVCRRLGMAEGLLGMAAREREAGKEVKFVTMERTAGQ